MKTENRTALAAAGITMLLWASAFIVIRAVGDHYSPGALALGRMLAGSIALSAVALVVRPRLPRGRPLLLVIAYGALWFGLYAVLVNASERHLDAGTAALVVNLGPILIAVLAGLYLGEGFPRSLIAGLAIAFAGVVIIATATSTGRHDFVGVLFALGAAALYAVGVLLQKRALGTVGAFAATWLGCLFGAVVCLPFAPDLLREAASAPASAGLGVVYLGLFPTAIAFGTWAYALKRTTAGRLSSSSYLVPGIAVLLSWLVLGEAPSLLALAGGVLCLAGVAVTRLGATRPAAAPTSPSSAGAPSPAPAAAASPTSSPSD